MLVQKAIEEEKLCKEDDENSDESISGHESDIEEKK